MYLFVDSYLCGIPKIIGVKAKQVGDLSFWKEFSRDRLLKWIGFQYKQ